MTDVLAAALAAVRGRGELGALRRGIEKESLRITPAGALASSPHPRALGSPLLHPHITTDFSEAQLELITGIHTSAEAALAELADIHRFVYANIGDELLWTASLPCRLGEERDIPIARFGTSNAGRLKTIYRVGLSHRYGRRMQTISGIHYNFSVPETLWPAIAASRGETAERDFVTRAYFGLIRNFRRYSWLLIYLFGASPAACGSFVEMPSGLRRLGEGSWHLPHATSLRMGRLGYQSDAQASLHISYNSLAQYAATMSAALTAPYPAYEAIGLKAPGGEGAEEYRQLNTALLQIENEFYGTIRPKRRTRSGERPLDALRERGVEYVEVRCMDLDPHLPLGIDAGTCVFLDVFLLVCLLDASPPDSRSESEILTANQLAVVERGRTPGLALDAGDGPVTLVDWAAELLDRCQQVAGVLDEATGDDRHASAVQAQRLKVRDSAHTPSARVLAATREHHASFFQFGLRRSALARAWFVERPLEASRGAELHRLSARSLAEQTQLEAAVQPRFDRYLDRYLELREPSASAPTRLN